MFNKVNLRIPLIVSLFVALVLLDNAWADPNLLLWYELDEMEGEIAHDSSDYENNGFVDENYGNPAWDPQGGYVNGCLILDNDTAVHVPPETLDPISSAITVSFWANGKIGQTSAWDMTVLDGGSGVAGPYQMMVLLPNMAGEVVWRAGGSSNDILTWEEANPGAWQGRWHHFAFVKDEDAGIMAIYFDGFLADSSGTVDATLSNIAGMPLKIGAYLHHSDDYEGKLDDFRIYDYALSEGQIQLVYRAGDVNTAWHPRPPDGESNVPPDVNFVWKPGDYAASHDVYFGTSWDDVNDADTSSGVFEGNFEPNEFDPNGLQLGATYYWRIDEVNDGNVWPGRVWRFATPDYFVIDDMESYEDSNNHIWDTWWDGCGDVNGMYGNGTGSCIELATDPCHPVHGGARSMKYFYDNTCGLPRGACYSQIVRQYAPPLDWTSHGQKVLTLWFHGGSDNDRTEMWVVLDHNVSARATYGGNGEDPQDIKKEDWTEWNVKLSDFADAGVDLAKVADISIGFGDNIDDLPDGSTGTVYFDDFQLYPRRCVPSYGPRYDFSGNCVVDLADLRIMAEDWLRTDANLVVEEPCDANLVGWWELDEGSGNQAGDSSIYANHGVLEGEYSWIPGRIGADAVEFTGSGGRALVPDAAQLRANHEVTAGAWINYSTAPPYPARVVVKGADLDDNESFALKTFGYGPSWAVGLGWSVRDVNRTLYGVDSLEELRSDEWIHIAGTYDGNTLKCYVNGQVSNSTTVGPVGILANADGLAIGNRADAMNRGFIGKVDDVRLYNRGLSDAEVAWLATEGGGYVPLTSVANIYDAESAGEKVVNFRDFGLLASDWLEESFWP